MIITYQGLQFIKIQQGDLTIAINPISKTSKHKSSRFGADIALCSINHEDMNGVDMLAHGDRNPFVISGPGEYEVGGIFVKGFASPSNYDGEERINTIYSFIVDGMNVCFLGAHDGANLSTEVKEAVDGVDILFVPIGGQGVLNAVEASKLAVKMEAKIVIPVHFGDVGDKDALKIFLKESDAEGVKAIDKLTLKRKDLDGKDGDVVVLEAQG
jgi:hypothetical protein